MLVQKFEFNIANLTQVNLFTFWPARPTTSFRFACCAVCRVGDG